MNSRSFLIGAVFVTAGGAVLGGCGSAKISTPPELKSPYETVRVNDAVVDIGHAKLAEGDTRTRDDDWVEAETKIYLAAREYTKPEVRSCIENALNATISKAWLHYNGEAGKTGEKIDYVCIGVFKDKTYATINVRANDNCIAGAEWFSPALTACDTEARSFLNSGAGYSVGGDSYSYSKDGTWYESTGKREDWSTANVVVFWDEDYFKE